MQTDWSVFIAQVFHLCKSHELKNCNERGNSPHGVGTRGDKTHVTFIIIIWQTLPLLKYSINCNFNIFVHWKGIMISFPQFQIHSISDLICCKRRR